MKSYYLSHYFDPKNAAPFLLLSFLGLVIVLAIVLITAKIQVHQKAECRRLLTADDPADSQPPPQAGVQPGRAFFRNGLLQHFDSDVSLTLLHH